MKVKDLKPNKRNPRKISEKRLTMLRQSLEKFGDLSGFVYNRRTKALISGHQRQSSVPPSANIVIEVKHEVPTHANTVAEGYVLIGGERFKYREVDAPEEWEMEAMLAANKHGGEWDRDKLRINFADFPSMDLEMTGFDMPELRAIGIEIPKFEPAVAYEPEPSPPAEAWDEEPAGTDEEADAAYIRETPGPESELTKENLPSMVNYEAVEEKIETKNVKHLIIIDCPSKELKESLREKLRAEKFPEQHGVTIY